MAPEHAHSILERFGQLRTWRRDGERAPHKPLLVLYALGRWQEGTRAITFEEVDRDVGRLLNEFGPPRRTTAVYPFCRLENDGVWIVDAPDDIVRRSGNREPLISELRRLNASGSFTPEVLASLDAAPELAGRLAQLLLDAHFPESVQTDILAAVGLDASTYATPRRKRDSSFRPRVLTAYEYQCCVCGFDARLGAMPIALEAAHIRWHQAGGMDVESNGLALCNIHHKTFDLGAFTIDDSLTVLVSDQVVGSSRVEEVLHSFHGAAIHPPQRPEFHPTPAALAWHRHEVFRGEPRHMP